MSKSAKLGPVETYKGDPTVNVKYYGEFGSVERVMAKFGCDKATAEQALQNAYDCAVRDFWHMQENAVRDAFGKDVEVFSEGRMGGHLIVVGLGEVAEWDEAMRAKWTTFAGEVKTDIEYCASENYIMEMIEVNEWAPTPLRAAQHEVEVAEHALECARKRLASLYVDVLVKQAHNE